MSSKIVVCQWEIWQASWEHEDGSKKDRPVLILSSLNYSNSHSEIWVAKFTKTEISKVPHIKFDKSSPSFAQTGLTETCHLYPSQARKIDKALLIRKRGSLATLSAALMAQMIKQLLKFPVE
jgi:mRNA-degrading endonuclease toxin of MazEF toxin-antitoxin module